MLKVYIVMYSDLDDKFIYNVYSSYEKAETAIYEATSGGTAYNPYYISECEVE
jgi:hypothetical protein